MSVENYFQEQLNVVPNTEIESNTVVFLNSATFVHTDVNTSVYINNSLVPNGSYTINPGDTLALKIISASNYSEHKHGIIKIDGRFHTFTTVTTKLIQPIHYEQFADKIPFEMDTYPDGSKISDFVFAARRNKHKITSFDKSLSIQYPDEQFNLDYDIGSNQFNSDTSYVTCSYYSDRVLRHSRRTKRLIASIPVSGHPCEFVEVPRIPGVDFVTNLWVTLSNRNKVVVINSGNEVEYELNVGSFPTGIIYNGTSVYVANSGDNSVTKFEWNGTNWIDSTLAIGVKPFQFTLDSSNNVWVSCAGENSVYKITNSSVSSHFVGDNPRGMVAANGNIWVTLSKTDKLVKLDENGNILLVVDDIGVHPYAITKPIEIGEVLESPYIQDDWFSSNALLLNVEDSYYGAHNGDIIDSSGAFITVTGNPQHTSFSPYQDAWSCEFNGSSITIPSSPHLYIGTSDFTIEFWVNFKDVTSQGLFHTSTNNLNGSMWCGYRYDGLMVAISAKEGTQSFGFWFTPEKNRWTHVAIARGAGATRIFINGQLRSTTTKLNGVDIKENGWILGNNSDTSVPFTGFMSDFHVTKTCKYVGSSDVNYDKITTDLFSTLYTLSSKNFIDETDKNHQILPQNGVKLSHFSPYSLGFSSSDNYSGLFAGTDYIETRIEENLASKDFTLELWIYRNSASNSNLLELGNLIVRETGSIDGIVGDITSLKFGEWRHLAIVRRDGVIYRYIDGNLIDSITVTYHVTGRNCKLFNSFSGYVMNFRFTVSAVYTSSFIVPSKVLVLPQTKILLKFRNAGIVDLTGKNVVETPKHPLTHSLSKFGDYALSFNTKTIKIAHKSHFTLWNRDLTIEFWINTTDKNCTLISKANSTFTQNSWRIKLVNGIVVFDHSSLGLGYLTGISDIADGNWHHIAITKFKRTERLFVDGVREALQTIILNTFIEFPNTVHEQTTTPFYIKANMESGDIFDFTSSSSITFPSGSEYVTFDGNNIVTADIVPNKSFNVQASTTYKGDSFNINKTVDITHNPELVSIEILGPASIIERTSGTYTVMASMSDGTSYIADSSLVTWELYSDHATINSTGVVQTNNIVESSKIITIHATYTDNGIEPVTKTSSKTVVVTYYPELISTTISVPSNSLTINGAIIQMNVEGTLENGASVTLPSTVWSIVTGNTYASITAGGLLTLNSNSANQTITIRAVSEYIAGIVLNTITTDYVMNIQSDFLGVELLISGDVLSTTETSLLTDIIISGPSIVSEDETYQFEAIGTFDNGTIRNVSAFTDWSISSGSSFASITSLGVLIPADVLVDRNITIFASTVVAGINKTASKNVTIDYIPKLQSVSIDNVSFNELVVGQLSATGFWDDGSSFAANSYTTWELISGSQFATVSSSGQIQTLEVPTENAIVRVRASTTRGTITKTTEKDLTIINLPKLISLSIIKGAGILSPGSFTQFTTNGILENSSIVDVTSFTTWSVTIGSISSTGILNIPLGTAVGTNITISATATYQNGTSTATYSFNVEDDFGNVELLLSGDILNTTIIPQITGIIINGSDLVTEQTTSQYTVTGLFNNGGANLDVTSKTTWSIISGASFASISSNGILTAANITGSDKSVTIRATTTYRGTTVTSDKTITIDIVPVFSSVTINGANSVIEQQSSTYTATGNMDDGTSFDATPYVTWSIVSGASFASINSSGVLSANNVTASNRSVVIRATVVYSGITITQDKTITVIWEPIFESTTITGTNSIYEFGYSQLAITGYYDGGTSFDAMSYTTWSVISGSTIATVNSTGYVLATGGAGTVVVQATTTHLGITVVNTFSVTVMSAQSLVELLLSGDVLSTTIIPVLTSGTINGSDTVIEGQSSTYTLTGNFNNGGASQDLSYKTTWSIVSGGSFGSINSTSGVFTAANITPPNRSVTIRATTTYRGVTITTDRTITVNYIQTFSSVTINGPSSINENSSATYTATGNMDDGVTFDATPFVTWSIVSGASFASINSSGLVTTNNVTANQSVTIRASVTYNSITITQDRVITVTWIPLFASVDLSGVTTFIMPGTTQLTAIGTMEDATTFDAIPFSTFTVLSGSLYASVDTSGLVTINSSAPNGTVVTIQVETTYNGLVKYDTHSITLQVSLSDPYFANVALLLNGENVTNYTTFSLGVAVQLSGENLKLDSSYLERASILISGDTPMQYTELSYTSVLISGETV